MENESKQLFTDHRPLGERMKPLLLILEQSIWDEEAENPGAFPKFDDECFRASIKIFLTGLLERIWGLQDKENIDFEDRKNMVIKAAEDIRSLIKVYTNIDTFELYGKEDIEA